MLRQYETTIVIDAHLPGESVDASIAKYSKLIEENKGKVKSIDRWGKRRLAYEIAKKQYGYYVYIRFEVESAFLKEMERQFKLDDSVLRTLTVLVPKVVLNQEQKKKSESKEKELEKKSTSMDMPKVEATEESITPVAEEPKSEEKPQDGDNEETMNKHDE